MFASVLFSLRSEKRGVCLQQGRVAVKRQHQVPVWAQTVLLFVSENNCSASDPTHFPLTHVSLFLLTSCRADSLFLGPRVQTETALCLGVLRSPHKILYNAQVSTTKNKVWTCCEDVRSATKPFSVDSMRLESTETHLNIRHQLVLWI